MKRMALVLTSSLCLALPVSASAADIPVAPGQGSLAGAIRTADAGDRLILQAGTYGGGVTLDQTLSIIGQNGTEVIGPDEGSVITVNAPDITISGLTIRGSGSDHQNIDSGVQLTKKAKGAQIIDNRFEGNLYGVDVHGAKNALVENNTIIGRRDRLMNRRGNGIYIWNAPGTKVIGNSVRYGRDGIFVNSSRKNVFSNNRFEDLRFAVHYMYADNTEVTGNVSIGNHLGFAIMFSTRVKVIGNTSIRDRDHGIMLNYANSSVIEGNIVREGGEKCLFMYNANKNKLLNNTFEKCQIGIHFTAGSDRNTIAGNAFVGSKTQVKYVGTKDHTWTGNYWSDHSAYDVNGDGIADQAFRPNDAMDHILWTQPSAKLLLGSPAIQLIRWAQKEFPALLPGGVVDDAPLMNAPQALAPLAKQASLK